MATSSTGQAEVTQLLKDWRAGREEAAERLLRVVYAELRRMARHHLARERNRHTFQATDLVHEAFLRLVDQKAGWQNRLHFYAIASRCMRRVLVDHARRKRAAKRPPLQGATDLENLNLSAGSGVETLLALDEVLTKMQEGAPRQVRIVELKVFGGLEISEIARAVGVSEATVKRDWAEAKKQLTMNLAETSRPAT